MPSAVTTRGPRSAARRRTGHAVAFGRDRGATRFPHTAPTNEKLLARVRTPLPTRRDSGLARGRSRAPGVRLAPQSIRKPRGALPWRLEAGRRTAAPRSGLLAAGPVPFYGTPPRPPVRGLIVRGGFDARLRSRHRAKTLSPGLETRLRTPVWRKTTVQRLRFVDWRSGHARRWPGRRPSASLPAVSISLTLPRLQERHGPR